PARPGGGVAVRQTTPRDPARAEVCRSGRNTTRPCARSRATHRRCAAKRAPGRVTLRDRRVPMRTAITWAAVVVTACGGGRPDISTTQDNVCDEVATVACFNMYKCCSEGEIERFLGVSDPRTIDQCHSDVHAICERQLATIDFSVKNKRVRFDSKLMNDCLDAFLAPEDSCVDIAQAKPWTAACMQSAWVGVVANAGACDFGYECIKDSFCSASRMCAALPTDGMPCGIQGCASGFYC